MNLGSVLSAIVPFKDDEEEAPNSDRDAHEALASFRFADDHTDKQKSIHEEARRIHVYEVLL